MGIELKGSTTNNRQQGEDKTNDKQDGDKGLEEAEDESEHSRND